MVGRWCCTRCWTAPAGCRPRCGPHLSGACGGEHPPRLARPAQEDAAVDPLLAVNRSLIERLRRSAGRQAMPEPSRPAHAVSARRRPLTRRSPAIAAAPQNRLLTMLRQPVYGRRRGHRTAAAGHGRGHVSGRDRSKRWNRHALPQAFPPAGMPPSRQVARSRLPGLFSLPGIGAVGAPLTLGPHPGRPGSS